MHWTVTESKTQRFECTLEEYVNMCEKRGFLPLKKTGPDDSPCRKCQNLTERQNSIKVLSWWPVWTDIAKYWHFNKNASWHFCHFLILFCQGDLFFASAVSISSCSHYQEALVSLVHFLWEYARIYSTVKVHLKPNKYVKEKKYLRILSKMMNNFKVQR